jgi:hypothetical protein
MGVSTCMQQNTTTKTIFRNGIAFTMEVALDLAASIV